MSPVPRLQADHGPALLSYGFRPFFLFGALYAGLGVLAWLPMFYGELKVSTAFSPVDWHVHELLYGYLSAVVAGFLLTAIPNWTGRLPIQGTPLLALVVVWVAGRIGVGEAVALGSGEEETGGREKASILADTLEALIGAVYLDGGIEAVRRVVLAHWAPLVADQIAAPGERDYKTRLQEVLAQQGQTPSYVSEGEGPEHARVFFATVAVGGRLLGMGTGTSKKRAEQAAARHALDTLSTEGAADA